MKNFRVQIRYNGYYADFNVNANDNPQDIENSILDKLGKNEVKFESDGFTNKKGKWITYEEVIMIQDLYKQKKSLELSWEQEYNESGKYTLNMVEIDEKIKGIITQIKLEEARQEDLRNKIADSRSEVSIAT